jgi:hypothetical protein
MRAQVKKPLEPRKAVKPPAECAEGQCLCGAVRLEIDVPARWAWHDHSPASRRAHGAAYATYVGSYRSRFRITEGAEEITRFHDKTTGTVRSFCARCGTPIAYERPRAPVMVNIPRALFDTRTGREPRYHIAIDELRDWAYTGAPLAPLKGYPGVVWERPRRKKRPERGG